MATNFLWYSGVTSNDGLLVASVSLVTTELNNLATGSLALSSVNGSSGAFVNTYFGQGMLADIFLNCGGPALAGTLSAGANLAGWFLVSPDGGTTYEWSNGNTQQPPRPPDFLVPLPAATSLAAASVFKGAGPIMVPPGVFKIIVQNNSGQTLAPSTTSSPYIKLAPYAMQY